MAVAALVIYVAMFLIVFVARSIIQKRATGDTGIRAGVLGAGVGSLEWIAGWLLVLALLAGFGAPIADLAELDPLTTSPWLRGAGIVMAGVGVGLTFLAQLHMGTEWRIGIDADEHTGLVTGGAFGVVRNPIFSALIVAALGLTLMVPNLIAIFALVALVVAVELQVRFVEEPHLARIHGDAYADHSSRVGRFVPRLSPR